MKSDLDEEPSRKIQGPPWEESESKRERESERFEREKKGKGKVKWKRGRKNEGKDFGSQLCEM